MLAVGGRYAMCRSWGFVLAGESFASERDVGRVRTLVEPTGAIDEDEVVLRLPLQK